MVLKLSCILRSNFISLLILYVYNQNRTSAQLQLVEMDRKKYIYIFNALSYVCMLVERWAREKDLFLRMCSRNTRVEDRPPRMRAARIQYTSRDLFV